MIPAVMMASAKMVTPEMWLPTDGDGGWRCMMMMGVEGSDEDGDDADDGQRLLRVRPPGNARAMQMAQPPSTRIRHMGLHVVRHERQERAPSPMPHFGTGGEPRRGAPHTHRKSHRAALGPQDHVGPERGEGDRGTRTPVSAIR